MTAGGDVSKSCYLLRQLGTVQNDSSGVITVCGSDGDEMSKRAYQHK
jgi:hypothetical protein